MAMQSIPMLGAVSQRRLARFAAAAFVCFGSFGLQGCIDRSHDYERQAPPYDASEDADADWEPAFGIDDNDLPFEICNTRERLHSADGQKCSATQGWLGYYEQTCHDNGRMAAFCLASDPNLLCCCHPDAIRKTLLKRAKFSRTGMSCFPSHAVFDGRSLAEVLVLEPTSTEGDLRNPSNAAHEGAAAERAAAASFHTQVADPRPSTKAKRESAAATPAAVAISYAQVVGMRSPTSAAQDSTAAEHSATVTAHAPVAGERAPSTSKQHSAATEPTVVASSHAQFGGQRPPTNVTQEGEAVKPAVVASFHAQVFGAHPAAVASNHAAFAQVGVTPNALASLLHGRMERLGRPPFAGGGQDALAASVPVGVRVDARGREAAMLQSHIARTSGASTPCGPRRPSPKSSNSDGGSGAPPAEPTQEVRADEAVDTQEASEDDHFVKPHLRN